MNNKAVYQLLENKMLRYADLSGVPVRPIGEALVPIEKGTSIKAKPINDDMAPYTGDLIYVRKTVLDKLNTAAALLTKNNPEMRLQVVYGYRSLEIQKKLFLYYKNRLADSFSGEALLEVTHRLIAVPKVAGHPTGGAVDIQIIQGDVPLSMGTNIWEFVKDSFTFSPFVSQESQSNRLLLRDLMLTVGFAPFDGEWWHFSYGDKEWARYYKKPFAIYEQLDFKSISQKEPQ